MHSHPTLTTSDWQLLDPPIGDVHLHNDKIEVGIIEVHPCLDRIAYATRTRTDQSHDLGKARIVIHDFDAPTTASFSNAAAAAAAAETTASNVNNGRVICSFSLRELTCKINEFRLSNSQLASSIVAASAHSREIPYSLSNTTASSSSNSVSVVMPLTVNLLGAVQNLEFLDRAAIRSTVASGFVREDDVMTDASRTQEIHRLMIGFRRCIVVVALSNLKDQKESYAKGISVLAYIGPDDMEECHAWCHHAGGDGQYYYPKKKKRQPASFSVPVSEHILAYGCYDGGLRFYDMAGKKQAKSALGPNGRDNPIVRVINANPSMYSQSKQLQATRPRIICACASGVAYLWELDLSVDNTTGEIFHFKIPPPLVSFDAFKTAAIGQCVLPATKQPPRSPSSVASLSPCSSLDEIDLVNSQFELSYDQDRNILFWILSPECSGASLDRPASRSEERLDADGVLVSWDLPTLSSSGWPPVVWPPPMAAPLCVTKLPRTDGGKISSTMVLPGVLTDILSESIIATIYATSSGEIVALTTNMEDKHGDSIEFDVGISILSDISKYNNVCYSIARSTIHPSLVFFGTQHGILLARINGSSDEDVVHQDLFTIDEEQSKPDVESLFSVSVQNEVEGGTHQHSTQFDKNDKVGDLTQLRRLKGKISELELRNLELDQKLENMKVESTLAMGNLEQNSLLKARVTAMLEQQQRFHDFAKKEVESLQAKVNSLETELSARNESFASLAAETGKMRRVMGEVSGMLEKERSLNKSTNNQLKNIMEKVKKMEEEVVAKVKDNQSLRVENDALSRQLEDLSTLNNIVTNDEEPAQSISVQCEISKIEQLGALRRELCAAKETEESLRNYINLLEDDKHSLENELDEARQTTEENKFIILDLQADNKEHKYSIDSLVNLLEHQKNSHEKEVADKNDKISEMQSKLKEEIHNTEQAMLQCRCGNDTIAKLRAENAKLKKDASQTNSMFIAMKVELQNALNDLADYQHERNTLL